MINLLPPFARKHIIIAYWLRVVTLWLFVLSLTVLMVLLLYATVYIQVGQAMSGVKQSVGQAEEQQAFIAESVELISFTNDRVELLQERSQYASMTSYIAEIENLAGPEVSLTAITIERSDEAWPPLQIEAVANTRQDLISFLDSIETHASFGAVDVPIANLAQSQNITFSLQVPIVPGVDIGS